jgi:nucleoside-diphosphate-sugar epimerase
VKIAVLGASGVVGRALLPLLAGEHEVVAVSRRPRDRSGDGVRWVAADVTERDELDGLFDCIDVVYHLVSSRAPRS